jgi:hypothetical protein
MKTQTMKSLLITIILLYSIAPSHAQKFSTTLPETREVVLNAADTIKKIRIFIANPKVKIEGSKFYAWYQKQIVLHTQGAWSGKLLQGKYESFYPNHNLLEQGIYEKGWKVGLWKQWYANGTLKEQVVWKKGLKHGVFEAFDVSGQLVEKGTYRNGFLQGHFSTFENGAETKVKYRKDKVIIKNPKYNLFQFFKKKGQPAEIPTSKTAKKDSKKEAKKPKNKKVKAAKKVKAKKEKKKKPKPKKTKEEK